jgi:hypothetical protein
MRKVINIPQIVGGNSAYVGFTGGTGGLSASQKLMSWTYATQSVPPTFSPAAGTYKSAQSVTLHSATANAAIYFTTNGTTPTAISTRYSRPIVVDSPNETIEAIAISPTEGSSLVKSAAYIIDASPAIKLTATAPKAIAPGGTSTSTVTMTPMFGFKGSLALKCAITAKPNDAIDAPTCTASHPAPITGTGAVTATLTFKSQTATTRGDYTATVTGTSGSVTGKVNVVITVIGPTFTLSASPVSVPTPGKSATSTLTITPKDGFKGSLQIKCAIVARPADAVHPPTCTATQPAAITGTLPVTSKLTVATLATTTKGAYTVTVTANTKGVIETTNLAVRVALPAVRSGRRPVKRLNSVPPK